jgi:hypothetical protein
MQIVDEYPPCLGIPSQSYDLGFALIDSGRPFLIVGRQCDGLYEYALQADQVVDGDGIRVPITQASHHDLFIDGLRDENPFIQLGQQS